MDVINQLSSNDTEIILISAVKVIFKINLIVVLIVNLYIYLEVIAWNTIYGKISRDYDIKYR